MSKKNVELLKDMLEAVVEAHDLVSRGKTIDKRLADMEKELDDKSNELKTRQKRLDNLGLKKEEQQKAIEKMLEEAKNEAENIKTKVCKEAMAEKNKVLAQAKAATTRKNNAIDAAIVKEKQLLDLDKQIKEYNNKLEAVKSEAKKLMGEL